MVSGVFCCFCGILDSQKEILFFSVSIQGGVPNCKPSITIGLSIYIILSVIIFYIECYN